MSQSKRKLIRQYVMGLLENAQTPANGNVYPHRGQLLDEHLVPCYLVHTPEEEGEPRNVGKPRTYLRSMTLEVAAAAINQPADRVEDALDDMAQAAEETILADTTLGGLAGDVVYRGVKPQIGRGGMVLPGIINIHFEVSYYS